MTVTRTGDKSFRDEKDPDATLDWVLELDAWLLDSDTVTDHDVAIVGDVTESEASSHAGPFTVKNRDGTERTVTKGVRVKLAGGSAGTTSKVTFRVTSAQGLVDDFSLDLAIREN
ncbi:MAG: hypothetical protein AAGA99_12150, partial [Actinomycetota bacterium]